MIRVAHGWSKALSVMVILICASLLPSAARADTQIESFESLPTSTQAGGHPNFITRFTLSSNQTNPNPCGCDDARDAIAHLPAGLIGNPHATPQCDIAEFSGDECPVDAQVGVAYVSISALAKAGKFENQSFLTPVYNLIPPPTQPALLGFKSGGLFDTPTFEDVSARTDSDYGLDVAARSIEHFAPLTGFEQLTWGTPADPANDNFRYGFKQKATFMLALGGSHSSPFCDSEGNVSTSDPATIVRVCPLNHGAVNDEAVGEFPEFAIAAEAGPGHPVSSNSPLTPFIQSQTTCGVPLLTDFEVLSYDRGITNATSPWPATTGCDRLTFNPSQAISPTTEAADSPSGAEFTLTVPQFESQSVPSPSELRGARVTLPAGFALAPNVMNGKVTCSDAEARFGTTEAAQCPENAKIGTLVVNTPVLPGPLPGAAYLGEPKPGNRYRIFLVFDGFGVHIKLPGTIEPDPQTGQIHMSFEDLPQAPFESFELHIFGSERGPLATPTQCGTYEVKSEWEPWDAGLSEQTSRQFFAIDEGPNGRPCPSGPRPFAPGFQAASTASTAGSHTAFWLNLTREDGEQNLSGLTVTTPPGFSASLKGIPYCPEAYVTKLSEPSYSGLSEQTSPLCSASQLGTVTAAAGAGSHPLYLPGKVYLAGPYKGAPVSLEIVIPAVAGPYDLGNVAVRAAAHIDPETAQITTVSDPFPQIFGGIPIRVRQIYVNLNRPGFALNPTDCEPLSIQAQLSGDEGGLSSSTQHFQASNCASLPFAPKLSLKLSGGVNRLGHPAIHALVQTQPGEANPSSIAVTLPPNEQLDQAHIVSICTKVQFAAQTCPAGSLVGHAEVTTPLLDKPLSGNAYLRSSAKGLPNLALDLNGQIHIVAVARIDAVNGGLRTTFQTVPDAPLGSISLDLQGGSKGLILNSESLCGTHQKATVKMSGQNGAALNRKVALQAACGKAAKHKKHKERGGGH